MTFACAGNEANKLQRVSQFLGSGKGKLEVNLGKKVGFIFLSAPEALTEKLIAGDLARDSKYQE